MKHPECERDGGECRIASQNEGMTAMYYAPIYDGNGRNLNPDRNSTFYSCSCVTCGRAWREIHKGGVVTVKDIAPQPKDTPA